MSRIDSCQVAKRLSADWVRPATLGEYLHHGGGRQALDGAPGVARARSERVLGKHGGGRELLYAASAMTLGFLGAARRFQTWSHRMDVLLRLACRRASLQSWARSVVRAFAVGRASVRMGEPRYSWPPARERHGVDRRRDVCVER